MVRRREVLQLRSSNDIVRARQSVRALSAEQGFTLVDQTKIVTAASELARNTLDYGRGGTVVLEALEEGTRRGIRLVFEDEGPGIADVALALRDGYTSRNGMGLGLGGSKRLMHEFDIQSTVGEGTRVTVVRWK